MGGPPVCHIKVEASRYLPCPRTQQASLPACSPHYPIFMLGAKQGSCEYHFSKSFGVPLSALPKDTTSKLAGLFSTLSPFYAEAGKLKMPFYKVFWYGSTLGMNRVTIF